MGHNVSSESVVGDVMENVFLATQRSNSCSRLRGTKSEKYAILKIDRYKIVKLKNLKTEKLKN
jgi:hypothetical protein